MALNVGDRFGHYDVTALIGEGGRGQVYRATDTILGPYEVTTKIGEGGMGEVHRARDTTLDRDVALEGLPVGPAAMWIVLTPAGSVV